MQVIIGIIVLLFILGVIGAIITGIGEVIEENPGFRLFVLSLISMFCFWNVINNFDFFYFLLHDNGSVNWLGITLCVIIFLLPLIIYMISNTDLAEGIIIMPSAIILIWLINFTGLPSFVNKQFIKPEEGKEFAVADRYFEAFLVRKGLDLKIDGKLVESEIFDVEELDLSEESSAALISSLEGVEKFQYLKTLRISSKSLKSLDLSKNNRLESLTLETESLERLLLPASLKKLKCTQSNLKNLDLSQNYRLEYLNVANNRLETLELPNRTRYSHLETLICSDNELKGIDVSTNPVLRDLNCENNVLEKLLFHISDEDSRIYDLKCGNNLITELHLPQGIREVDCSNNRLTEFSVPSSVRELDCSSNELRLLNLSDANELSELNCSVNQLSSLDLNGNPQLEELNIRENNIQKIDVITALALKNIYFDSDTTEVIYDRGMNQNLNL